MEIVYIDKSDEDNTELSDALFWADYLVDDDTGVAPVLLTEINTDNDAPDKPQ